ncbi:uncharacterized protein LOC131944348 [Physella acuta]|uniref:uncharacterized protein LOC131944348 n=1 Tax=Physella acuta TaxID=109671 RepID=UPI0027DD6928|nr:uncharacterized protein LOC131944348 [Physella acuta]
MKRGVEKMFSMSIVSLVSVAVLFWSVLKPTTGQLITLNYSQGTNYSQPLYCNDTFTFIYDCRPGACYWSGSRSECCMKRSTSSSGIIYDQCKCSDKVGCQATTDTGSTDPVYCTSDSLTTLTKRCAQYDQCFLASTRSKCCFRTPGGYVTAISAVGFDPQCWCQSTVTC